MECKMLKKEPLSGSSM